MRVHVWVLPHFCRAMEGTAVWTKLSALSLPRSLRRFLLLGVPSVTLLALLGLVGWRWTRRRKRQGVQEKPQGNNRETLPLKAKDTTEEPLASSDGQSLPSMQAWGTGARARGYAASSLPPPTSSGDHTRREQLQDLMVAANVHPSGHQNGPSVSSDVLSEGFSEALSISSSVSDELAPLNPKIQSDLNLRSHSTELIGKPIKRSSLIPATSSIPSFSSLRVQSPISPGSDDLYTSQLKNTPLTPLTPAYGEGPRIKVAVQLPKDLVGRFIGKQGRNIKALMLESGAHIYVNQKNLPEDAAEVPCHVQGNSAQIDHALKIISSKFPTVDIPSWLDEGIASQSTNTSPGTPFTSPLQVPGNEDWNVQLKPATVPSTSPFYALVSYIEGMTRIWLVPYESNPALDSLHQQMSYYYSYSSSSVSPSASPSSLLASLNLSVGPGEDEVKPIGKYCAVKVSDIHWLRGHVTQLSDDGTNYEVQLVDYGSTVIVPIIAIKPLL